MTLLNYLLASIVCALLAGPVGIMIPLGVGFVHSLVFITKKIANFTINY